MCLHFLAECYISRKGKQNPTSPVLYNSRGTILHKVKDQACAGKSLILEIEAMKMSAADYLIKPVGVMT